MNDETYGQKILLEVGDRVEAIGYVGRIHLGGKRGVVKYIDSGGSRPVLVEFSKPFDEGHDGTGRCKPGHGWWGEHEDFKVIKTKKRRK